MQSSFSSDKRKIKVLKKIISRIRMGKKAITCFSELAEKIELSGDPFYKLNPIYAFLDNGRKVMGSGGKLSECFIGWLEPSQIVLIKTGEKTGRVPESLQQCIDFETKIQTIKKAVKRASYTPAFAIILLLVVLVAAYQKGIPMLQDMLDMSEWGEVALNFYELTSIFGAEPIMTILYFVVFSFAYIWSIGNLDIKSYPAFRDALDKYAPFFGIYRALQASIFLSSLATLLSSGVRIKSALELIEENSGSYVANRVSYMSKEIATGGDLGSCFRITFLGESGEDLADMANGDSLEEALIEVSNETITEVMDTLPIKLSLIGKLIILVCICVVFFGIGALFEIVQSIT